jgi:hypothetical protein
MFLRRRRRFHDVIERQLDLFEKASADLLGDVEARLLAYDEAEADEAEERFGEVVDAADAAREELEALRDAYARTLDEASAEEYAAAFNDLARRRFPRITLELD